LFKASPLFEMETGEKLKLFTCAVMVVMLPLSPHAGAPGSLASSLSLFVLRDGSPFAAPLERAFGIQCWKVVLHLSIGRTDPEV
jgi:hypothetical protein